MDWFTFIVKLSEALAWPVVAVTVFLILRKPIGDAITAWETFKGKVKDVEWEFKRTLAVAREKAEDAGLPSASEATASTTTTTTTTPDPNRSFHPSAFERYKRLIEISPSAGIIEAWTDIEIAINRAAACHGISQPMSMSQLISELTTRGCWNHRIESLIDELRTLRNEVVHGRNLSISKDDAIEYVMIAIRVVSRIC